MPETPPPTGVFWFDEVIEAVVAAGWPTEWLTGEMDVWVCGKRANARMHLDPHCSKIPSHAKPNCVTTTRHEWLTRESQACCVCFDMAVLRGVPVSRRALQNGSTTTGRARFREDIRDVARVLVDIRNGINPERETAIEALSNARHVSSLNVPGFDLVGIAGAYKQAVVEIADYLYTRTATPSDTPEYRASQIAASMMSPNQIGWRCEQASAELYGPDWNGWTGKALEAASLEVEQAFARGAGRDEIAVSCTNGLTSVARGIREGAGLELANGARFSKIAATFATWSTDRAFDDLTSAGALDRFAEAIMAPAIAERAGQIVADNLFEAVTQLTAATPTVVHQVVSPYGSSRNEISERLAGVFPYACTEHRELIVLPLGFPCGNDRHGQWVYPHSGIDAGRELSVAELQTMLAAIEALDTNEYHPDSAREITPEHMRAALLLLTS